MNLNHMIEQGQKLLSHDGPGYLTSIQSMAYSLAAIAELLTRLVALEEQKYEEAQDET